MPVNAMPPFLLHAPGIDAATDKRIVKAILGATGERRTIRRLPSGTLFDVASMSWMVDAFKADRRHLAYAIIRKALSEDGIKAFHDPRIMRGCETCQINFDVLVRNQPTPGYAILSFLHSSRQLHCVEIREGDVGLGRAIGSYSPPDEIRGIHSSQRWNMGRLVLETDLEPFLVLAHVHRHIFEKGDIAIVPDKNLTEENSIGVAIDECQVINASRGRRLSTTGVSSAVAVCAQARSDEGEIILGLYHSSGKHAAEDVMAELRRQMVSMRVEASSIRYRLAGGLVSSHGEPDSSAHLERLLETKANYVIDAARVPLSVESIGPNGRRNAVNLVVDTRNIRFCEDRSR